MSKLQTDSLVATSLTTSTQGNKEKQQKVQQQL